MVICGEKRKHLCTESFSRLVMCEDGKDRFVLESFLFTIDDEEFSFIL